MKDKQSPPPDTVRQTMTARLQAERESRGWSHPYLAGKLNDASAGIGPVPQDESIIPQIRRWERGAVGISQRYRALYCIAFGMGPNCGTGGSYDACHRR